MEEQGNPHVLLEMKSEPDCRFVATWLIKAAEAEEFWSQALSDPIFAEQVALLHVIGIPHLEAFALEIFGKLEESELVVALDLYSDENGLLCNEFTLLAQLGFFVCIDGNYRIAIPETITFAKVKQAALDVMSTVGDVRSNEDGIQPERLLHTMSHTEAEARRSRLIELRRFSAYAPYDRKIQ